MISRRLGLNTAAVCVACGRNLSLHDPPLMCAGGLLLPKMTLIPAAAKSVVTHAGPRTAGEEKRASAEAVPGRLGTGVELSAKGGGRKKMR